MKEPPSNGRFVLLVLKDGRELVGWFDRGINGYYKRGMAYENLRGLVSDWREV